ncbi:YHYH protein [Stieleria sp. JC731]|nr:YHYH protein [Stieleria sp. JC731]MCC9599406.1 YHYH protein [Stieleria sp. JC731]
MAVLFVTASNAMAHEGHHHHDENTLITAIAGNPAGTFQSKVTITESNGVRIIKSNGLPSHATGQFPGPRNPNQIREQQYEFRVPLTPQPASRPKELKLGKFGVALNGVPIDPGAAEFWNRDFQSPWQYAVINGKIDLGLDMNSAHVQPGGEYHYHGRPADLIDQLHQQARKENKSMTLVGYAADGYPIYDCEIIGSDGKAKTLTASYRLKTGRRPSGSSGPGGRYDGTFIADWEYAHGKGDLDDFNGMWSKTPEYPEGTYIYVLTKEFPYVPRKFRGTPDDSFTLRGPGGPPGRPGSGRPGFGRPFAPPPFGPPPRRDR